MAFFDDKIFWKGNSRSFDPGFAMFVLIQPVLSLGYIGEFSRKTWLVTSNPISPRTPRNKAAILLLFTELRKLEIELFNENCCFKCSVKYLNDSILTLIRRYPAAHITTPTTARISIMVTAAGCLIKTNKVRVKSRRKDLSGLLYCIWYPPTPPPAKVEDQWNSSGIDQYSSGGRPIIYGIG